MATSARSLRIRRALASALLLALGLANASQSGWADDGAEPRSHPAPSTADRVIHTFDFDERAQGNTEPVPMYWVPLRRPGFPHYASGAFDFEVGHDAPPSFRLSSEGRSVAFLYSGPATRVRTNSEYRVEGYIRPDRLVHARACLSAHWIDKDGKDLAESLVRSEFIGSEDEPHNWVRVELRLPPAPPSAHALGLVAWVLQEAQWNPEATEPRRILRTDVHGGAWFDDLRVVRMPRMELATSSRTNVLLPHSPQELRVVLADPDDSSLHGAVTISDADGRPVAKFPVRVVLDAFAEPQRFPVEGLSPGVYRAVFQVQADETPIAREEVAFAVAAPLGERSEGATRTFGVALDHGGLRDPLSESQLLIEQLVRAAKIPIMTSPRDGQNDAGRERVMKESLRNLTHAGFDLVGVLTTAQTETALAGRSSTDTLVDLFSGDPSHWEESLGRVIAPLSDVISWWQLGRDDTPMFVLDRRSRDAAEALRRALRSYVTLPQIVLPCTATQVSDADGVPADGYSLEVSGLPDPRELARRLTAERDRLGTRTTAFVAPLGTDYARRPRIGDWARRVIAARHSGVDAVFVPQTWSLRPSSRGPQVEPDETFIVLRTIAYAIGSAVPGPRLAIGDGVECLTFHTGDTATYAIWDMSAPKVGKDRELLLGPRAKAFDLWGNELPVAPTEHGNTTLRLSSLPVLVTRVPAWLPSLQTAFELSPARIDAQVGAVELELTANYQGAAAVTADARIGLPSEWEVFPRELSLHLAPFRRVHFPLSVVIPSGEPAGTKSFPLAIRLVDEDVRFDVPLSIEIALADVEVSGSAVVQGDKLLLRHVVTSHAPSPLNFRAAAAVPGRERQHRPFTDLRPGETQVVEYRFRGGRELVGRRVRLTLNETNDGPRAHALELMVP